MLSFLEHFIVYWLYFVLLCVFVYVLYLLYVNKDIIFYQIKKHKIIYILLLILFVIGTILRVGFISTSNYFDEVAYTREGILITQNNLFSYLYAGGDSPSFSIFTSVFMRGLEILNKDYTMFTSNHTNAIFGSLSIILVFILAQLLFNNHQVSLLSALLITFNNLHLEGSVKGFFPTVSSTFLSMVVIILLINSIRTSSLFSYFIMGLALGFTAQMYYIELILVIPVILYFILTISRVVKLKNIPRFNRINVKFKSKKITKICIFILALIVSISPFVILANISIGGSCFKYNNIITLLSCIWSPGRNSLMLNGMDDVYLNHIDNIYFSFFSFAFLGIGSKSSFDATLPFNGWEFEGNNYNFVNNDLNIIYVIGSFLIIIGLVFSRSYWKEFFLILTAVISLIIVSAFSNLRHIFLLVPAIAFQLILISYGLVTLSKRIVKNPLFVIVPISMLLISPFFTEHMLTNLETIKGNTLRTNWENIRQILLEMNKTKCNNINLDRYRDECINMLDINNIVKNQSSCGIIENKHYKEKCLEQNKTYMLMKWAVNNSIGNITSAHNNPELCYNLSVLRFYCKVPTINERRSREYSISQNNCSRFNQTVRKDCLNVLDIHNKLSLDYDCLRENCFICSIGKNCFIESLFKIL